MSISEVKPEFSEQVTSLGRRFFSKINALRHLTVISGHAQQKFNSSEIKTEPLLSSCGIKILNLAADYKQPN